MLLSDTVNVVATPYNVNRINRTLGTTACVGDLVSIPVEKMWKSHDYYVDLQCDFCGEVFQQPTHRYFKLQKRAISKRHACKNCRTVKTRETVEDQYGCSSTLVLPEVREQTKSIFLSRYGTENILSAKEIRNKIENTNMSRYGVKNPMCLEDFREKSKATILARYGVENPMLVDKFAEKATTTKSKKNKQISKPQIEMFGAVKDLGYDCYLEYQNHSYLYDVAIFIGDTKIDMEYDGAYWHDMRSNSDEKRDMKTIRDGWKVIRFRSPRIGDIAPTKDQVAQSIERVLSGEDKVVLELSSNYTN